MQDIQAASLSRQEGLTRRCGYDSDRPYKKAIFGAPTFEFYWLSRYEIVANVLRDGANHVEEERKAFQFDTAMAPTHISVLRIFDGECHDRFLTENKGACHGIQNRHHLMGGKRHKKGHAQYNEVGPIRHGFPSDPRHPSDVEPVKRSCEPEQQYRDHDNADREPEGNVLNALNISRRWQKTDPQHMGQNERNEAHESKNNCDNTNQTIKENEPCRRTLHGIFFSHLYLPTRSLRKCGRFVSASTAHHSCRRRNKKPGAVAGFLNFHVLEDSSCPESSSASVTGSDASASARPWLRSGGCVRG